MNARVKINRLAPEIAKPAFEQPEAERGAAPVPVGQAAGRQQQSSEHECVRVDDPLELAVAGAEIAHERRERDVQDRVVETDHEQAQAQDPEDPPPPLVADRLYVRRRRRHAPAEIRSVTGSFRKGYGGPP
jgi:hypothetical protein